MNFVSIDFETANYSRVSICSAGLAVFEDGNLTEVPYWLVRPPKEKSWFREDFTKIHGLTRFDVQDAPDFAAIAPKFLKRLTRADIVIAHVAHFDIGALRATLAHFGLRSPDFDYLCTCNLARRIWPELSDHKLGTLTAHMPDSLLLQRTVPGNPSCSPERPPRSSLVPTVRCRSQRQNARISN